MSESIATIVRRDDNVAAHDGAHKAITVRSHHKRVALAVLYHESTLSAQDVREHALNMGLVTTISSAESVRRRVMELHSDGYVRMVDERGPTGATFALTGDGWAEARQAYDDLVRQGRLDADQTGQVS